MRRWSPTSSRRPRRPTGGRTGCSAPIVGMRCRGICGPRRGAGRRSRRRRSGSLRRPAAASSPRSPGSSLIRRSLRRRVAGVGARGTGRRTRSYCAGASRTRSRLRARELSGCSRRCTASRRTNRSRFRPARPMSGGRRSGASAACLDSDLGLPPKAYTPSPVPPGVNKTDRDSRMMRTQGQPTAQGIQHQAAVTCGQIIVAAEVAVESPRLRSSRTGRPSRAARA